MKKEYIVEFTMMDGTTETVSLVTDRIDWSIDQWKRNRAVSSHQILAEETTNNKRMLFG